MSGIYGWSDSGQKSKTWDMIHSLGSGPSSPWVIGGDFNEILQDSEKKGGIGGISGIFVPFVTV